MPVCSRKASVRVRTGGDICRKAARSTGLSISIPIPGWRTTSGSIPRAAPRRDAARSCRRRSAAAPRRAATDIGVRSEIVMRRHDGEGRRRADAPQASPRISADEARNVAGHGQHARPALADEQPRRRRHRAGMAVARALGDDARAVARGERCRDGIDRDDDDAGKLAAPRQRREHILEHRRRERAAFARGSAMTTAAASRRRAP